MTSLRGFAGFALQGFGQLRELTPCLADSPPVRRPRGRLRVARARRAHPRAPAVGHRLGRRRPPRGRGHRGGHRRHALRHAAALREGGGKKDGGAATAAPLPKVLLVSAALGPLRHAAAGHRPHAAPRAGRLGHRLAQRARRARRRRRLRLRRLHRAPHPLARGAGPRHARDRGVPAVRRRAGRHRGDGRGRQPRDAPHAHADGRAHRHARRSHRGQRPRHQQAAVVVRAQRDQPPCRCATRAHAAGCIPGSSSSRRSSA